MQKLKRLLITILKILGTTLILTIAIFFLPTWMPGFDKHDYVMIPNVDFASDGFEAAFVEWVRADERKAELEFASIEKPFFMSNYHWLKEGKHTALIGLKFTDRMLLIVDDEGFEKVTILVPKIEVGQFSVDGKSIRGFYSTGGSAWPRTQCGHEITNGNLEILAISTSSIKVKISLSGQCKRPNGKTENEISFSEAETFELLPLREAKPWHGKHGEHIYSETYRRL